MNQLPNLLIVDDTAENLILLAALIGKINVNLIKASSGAEALEKTRGIELALAIIDVRMPVMDGYELAMKLNEERTDDKVPVIFLTANYYNESELFKGYDSGAVDYIFKPLNSKILLSKISVFIDLFNQKQKIISGAKLLKTSTDELIQTNYTLKNREEKLEQEQIFNKALLDSIPGIFYLFTYPELRMVVWNKLHETLFGFDAIEMRGQHIFEWHLSETREAVLNSMVTYMETGQTSFKTSLMAKDGRLIPFILTFVKFENQGQIYLIGVGNDITEMIMK
jgi:PAS domain S-box-containing protein